MGDTRPIRQPPLRFLLAKQADVNEMLDDMKQRRMTEKSESLSSSPVVLVPVKK
jgi:hypothetical protein